MAAFIKLTAEADEEEILVWANLDLVTEIRADGGGACIYFGESDYTQVIESPDEIMKLATEIGVAHG